MKYRYVVDKTGIIVCTTDTLLDTITIVGECTSHEYNVLDYMQLRKEEMHRVQDTEFGEAVQVEGSSNYYINYGY